MAVEVTKRWQQLVTCAEERHKLVTASLNFYKTAEQVNPIFLVINNYLLLIIIEHTYINF